MLGTGLAFTISVSLDEEIGSGVTLPDILGTEKDVETLRKDKSSEGLLIDGLGSYGKFFDP